jgi:hypothetical protein
MEIPFKVSLNRLRGERILVERPAEQVFLAPPFTPEVAAKARAAVAQPVSAEGEGER